MPLILYRSVFHIQGSTFPHPILNHIVFRPVIQNIHQTIVKFQTFPVDKCFCRSSSDRIANQPDRNLQTVGKHTPETISDGRKIRHIFTIGQSPSGIGIIIQTIQGGQ